MLSVTKGRTVLDHCCYWTLPVIQRLGSLVDGWVYRYMFCIRFSWTTLSRSFQAYLLIIYFTPIIFQYTSIQYGIWTRFSITTRGRYSFTQVYRSFILYVFDNIIFSAVFVHTPYQRYYVLFNEYNAVTSKKNNPVAYTTDRKR